LYKHFEAKRLSRSIPKKSAVIEQFIDNFIAPKDLLFATKRAHVTIVLINIAEHAIAMLKSP
jgi:hypothetical protein